MKKKWFFWSLLVLVVFLFPSLRAFIVSVVFFYFWCKVVSWAWREYLSHTPLRRKVWERSLGTFYAVAGLYLLFGSYQRWHHFHDEMSYEEKREQNLAYADQIEVSAYLMNVQNVIDLFEGKDPDPDCSFVDIDDWDDHIRGPGKSRGSHSVYNEPTDPRFYLVIKVKNNGPQVAFGVLDYIVNGKKSKSIDVPPLPPKMKEYKNIVLQAHFLYRWTSCPNLGSRGPYPHLETKWDKLYTEVER